MARGVVTNLGQYEGEAELNPSAYHLALYRNGHYSGDQGLNEHAEALKIFDDLKGLGLTERESEVYITLSKRKTMKAGDLSRQVRLHKAQVYHILKSLQDKGLVDSTLEVPARFTAVPLEKFLSLSIRARIEDVKHLEKSRDEVLSRWRSMGSDVSSIPLERFQIVSGRGNVYARIIEMIDNANEEVEILTTRQGMIESFEADVHDAVLRRAKRKKGVTFRLLTGVTEENVAIVEEDLEKMRERGLSNIDRRHIEVEPGFFSRFVLKDEEAVVFVTSPDTSFPASEGQTALWTNNSSVTHILKMLFERLWHDSMDKDERLRQLNSEEHARHTVTIIDSQQAYEGLNVAIASAEQEIIGVTGQSGLFGPIIFPFHELFQRGIRMRIMTTMDVDTNQEETRALAKYCQVRAVNSTPMRAVLVDRKHLFQLKSPLNCGKTEAITAHPDSILYTDDPAYTEAFYLVLNELWSMSQGISGTSCEDPTVLLQHVTACPGQPSRL
jgi:sugar-specific transcriptional regulator TrmB